MNSDLPGSPEYFKTKYPLSFDQKLKIATWQNEIIDVLKGKKNPLLLICGPCSIHNTQAALEYAKKLLELKNEVQDSFYIIMRTYFEKPRTLFGWKGLLLDPEKDGSYNIDHGIIETRKFLLSLIDLGMPAAAEFVDPIASQYYSDLISWASIGARTAESPTHRELASSLDMAVGFKNRNCGSIEIAAQGACVAKTPHTFLSINQEGKACVKQSKGNRFPHIILRGSKEGVNYDKRSIEKAIGLLELFKLESAIIVDISHDNSKKNFLNQKAIFSHVLNDIQTYNTPVRGIMVESFLLESSQNDLLKHSSYSKEEIAYGASLTDPCLGWQDTEDLIRQAHLQNSLSLVHA